MKWALVMSEFAPICIYLVISPLVSLIPLGVPFPFDSNSSTYPEKLSAYECGSDPSGDARSHFDIRFYPVPILFIIPDPEVTDACCTPSSTGSSSPHISSSNSSSPAILTSGPMFLPSSSTHPSCHAQTLHVPWLPQAGDPSAMA
jgi:NADH-ubiquinone oxidoreductase chain 3